MVVPRAAYLKEQVRATCFRGDYVEAKKVANIKGDVGATRDFMSKATQSTEKK